MIPGFMVKVIFYLLLALGLGTGVFFLGLKLDYFKNPFETKPIQLLDTPTIVGEIREMSQLISICYYDQMVVDSDPKKETMPDAIRTIFERKSSTGNNLVLVASGKVYGGCDLSVFDSSDFEIQDTIITIKLQPAKILDVVMNPSDVSIFSEKGSWSLSEVNLLKTYAIRKFRDRAIEKGILNEAQARVQTSLTDFFTALGFSKVVFVIK